MGSDDVPDPRNLNLELQLHPIVTEAQLHATTGRSGPWRHFLIAAQPGTEVARLDPKNLVDRAVFQRYDVHSAAIHLQVGNDAKAGADDKRTTLARGKLGEVVVH